MRRLEDIEEFQVVRGRRRLGYVEEVEESIGDRGGSLVIETCSGDSLHVRVSSADVIEVEPSRCLVTVRPRARVVPVRPSRRT